MSAIYANTSLSRSGYRELLRPALGLALVMLLLCGAVYSAAVTSLGKLLFSHQATGSLVQQNGHYVGSALVAQPFSAGHYFHSRLSSVGYDPMATGGSNLAPSNPALRQRVAKSSELLSQQYQVAPTLLPVDLLASSGSGVDPHISPAAARLQLARVARQRNISATALEQLLQQHIEAKQWGVFGQPRVNVLLLNLALDQQFPL